VQLIVVVMEEHGSDSVAPEASTEQVPQPESAIEQDSSTFLPRDAMIMEEILKQMGVRKHDPRVISQLLEFTHSQLASKVMH